LRAYKRFLSPALPASCRFTPSCSEYAMEAVERHGAFIGTLLSTWRILRCSPFSHGGLDTVPEQILLWVSAERVLRRASKARGRSSAALRSPQFKETRNNN
jgi:hypothetical protein